MPQFSVSVRRRWFGEELETRLAEFDHRPDAAELVALARDHQLGGGATLHVRGPKGEGGSTAFRVRDLTSPPG